MYFFYNHRTNPYLVSLVENIENAGQIGKMDQI
jgi:hypothetical protein